ncbi:MAG: ISKra4 family transposase [Acidobacteriota bacterium]
MQLLRQLMQDHLDLRSVREQRRERVVGAEAIERREVKGSDRGLMTIFGPVNVPRLAYGRAGYSSLHPMDAALNLPKELYSHGLRRRVAEEVTKTSFDEVIAAIAQTTGATLAKRQAEELALRAAQDFELFYKQRKQQSESSSILVISTDAKGIVVRKDDLRQQTRKSAEQQNHKMAKRLSKGEKRNRKRMAQVASVYTIEPYVRSAEDIVKEFRPISQVDNKRPQVENKRVWASIEQSAETVIGSAFDEAQKRDPKLKKIWAILIDGNPIQLDIIERKVEQLSIEPFIIIDIIHVLGYLWKAAFAFNEEGSKEAEMWVTERLFALLQDNSQHVAAGMRRSATLRGLSKKEREPVDKCADYLLKYAPYLHYDEYLALGLPIATGVIEGACRHLIQDRMDINGYYWRSLVFERR